MSRTAPGAMLPAQSQAQPTEAEHASGTRTPVAAAPRARTGRGPLLAVLARFRVEIAWVLVFSAVANVLQLTPTLYMLQLFDRVMHSGNVLTLLAITALMLGFAASMAFAEWVRSQLLVRSGSRFDDALNAPVFRAAFEAQLRDPQRSPQQPLTDLNTVRQFLTGNGLFAIADTPWAVVFIAVLFVMHPWLGMLSVVFCVVQVGLALLARRWTRKPQKSMQAADMELGQYLQSKLRNVDAVAAMGMQAPLRRHWLDLRGRLLARQAEVGDVSARFQALVKWVQYTQQALMLALGALLAIEGKISAGAMVASNALMGNALRPMGILVQVWSQALDARAAWQRLDVLLRRTTRAHEKADLPPIVGQITLDGLTARAPNRNTPILDGLQAQFAAGETVAVVGPSGAGKSTLARCLLGIWPHLEGRVLLDGHDVTTLPSQDLGEHVGYLPQDIELFDGNIADNIGRFGRADAVAIVEAAKRAGIHDMLLRLPKGYDTPIGEAGALLSGGQRQRLGLARALLGKPRLVVLDEPNANLDDAGEAALLAAVRALKEDRCTVFMIVHRPHLLALADRVLFLEDGRIKQLAKVQPAPVPAPVPAAVERPPVVGASG